MPYSGRAKILRCLLAALAVTTCAALVSCSDNDAVDAEPTISDGPATADGEAAGTPRASETPVLDPSAQELIDIASQFGKSPAKISYSYSTTSPDGDFSGTMISYWLPPDQWRLDYDVEGQTSTLIGGGDVVYLCSAANGGGQCYEMDSGEAALPFAEAITDPSRLPEYIQQQLRGAAFERSERQIAGQAATCFSAGQAEEGVTEYCLGADGAALLVASTVQGITVRLEATAIDAVVSEEDFAIPYEIAEFDAG